MKGSETTTLAPDERRTRAQAAVTKPPDIETSYKPAPGYSQETHNRPLALLSLFSGHKPFGGMGKIVELYIKFLNQVISRFVYISLLILAGGFQGFHQHTYYRIPNV